MTSALIPGAQGQCCQPDPLRLFRKTRLASATRISVGPSTICAAPGPDPPCRRACAVPVDIEVKDLLAQGCQITAPQSFALILCDLLEHGVQAHPDRLISVYAHVLPLDV